MNAVVPRRVALARVRWRRVPVLLLAGVGLVFGLWAGLVRVGAPLAPQAALAVWAHGPLMVCGFFGALIAAERAAALDRGWAWGAPVLAGGATIALLAGVHWQAAALAWVLAAGVFVGASVACALRQPATYAWVLVGGAVAWLVGNVLWLAGWPVMRLVFWWAAFLVLTIAGERLELSRLGGVVRSRAFLAALGLFVGGVALSGWHADAGVRLLGVGLLALVAWLVRHDIVRRTVRRAGTPRYVAVSLLAGYAWLVVAGVLALVYGGHAGGFVYDALLHALFVGFVFSMVFGHAPIIAPALLRVPPPTVESLYLPLGLLHASLALRVVADLAGWFPGRRAGGMLNGLAVLLFVVLLVAALRAALRRRR